MNNIIKLNSYEPQLGGYKKVGTVEVNKYHIYMDFCFTAKLNFKTSTNKEKWGMNGWGQDFEASGYTLEKINDFFKDFEIKKLNDNSLNIYIGDQTLFLFPEKQKEPVEHCWNLIDINTTGLFFKNDLNIICHIKYEDFWSFLNIKERVK